MPDPILLETRERIGWITLNRPDDANTIDLPLAEALLSAVIGVSEDPAVRVVVLTGRGRFFCAGGDLQAIRNAPGGIPAELRQITAHMHAAISMLAHMDKPLVTGINGTAAGAGFSLAIQGDFALAAASASLKVAFTAIGLSPDCATTFLLPRLVGLRRALELTLENRVLSAEDARQLGLISRVVDDSRFEAELAALAGDLAARPTRALAATRRLILGAWNRTLEEQMALERQQLAQLGASRDASEGIDAFLENRPPTFRGE
jgi:2-(1,2-epoxy-1,2-dihydrophenyl)acetyl-CoA isomerase